MVREKKKFLKMFVTALVAMLAIPLAYRTWITLYPPSPSASFSLDAFFDQAAANRAARLFRTPLERWTSADRAAEPEIAAWLDAHAKVVLPWEWSNAARKKDFKGYCQVWEGLVNEILSALDGSISQNRKALMKLEGERWMKKIACRFHKSDEAQRDLCEIVRQIDRVKDELKQNESYRASFVRYGEEVSSTCEEWIGPLEETLVANMIHYLKN